MGSGASRGRRYDGPSDTEHAALLGEAFPFQGYIELTEHRGITLQQLEYIFAFARAHCGKWYDTAPKEYSRTSGQRLSIKTLNLYQLNTWLTLPATGARDCAVVELLTAAPQTPVWFISHWWGESIRDFLECVRGHMAVRGSGDGDPYWVCAHANRQHSLGLDVVADPRETSFYKAMQLVEGVLLILDAATPTSGPATPFTRIWCAFEEYVALADDGRSAHLLLDVATYHKGKAQLLTDGVTKADASMNEKGGGAMGDVWVLKGRRERDFPEAIFCKGLTVALENAVASADIDRVHILNVIAGNERLDDAPPAQHPNYELVNRRLRSKFALAAWPHASRKRMVETLGLGEILRSDTALREVTFNFGCSATDETVHEFTTHLPRGLQRLRLGLAFTRMVTDEGMKQLGADVAELPDLAVLSVNVMGCSSVGDAGVSGFAVALARLQHLREIEVNVNKFPCMHHHGAHVIGDAGLSSFASALTAHAGLTHATLDFEHCTSIGDAGVENLGLSLQKLQQLKHVTLKLTEASAGDSGVTALASGLAGLQQLEGVHINLFRCSGVRDAGAVALVDALEGMRNLSRVSLNLSATGVGSAGAKRIFLGLKGVPQENVSTSYPTPDGAPDIFKQWAAGGGAGE